MRVLLVLLAATITWLNIEGINADKFPYCKNEYSITSAHCQFLRKYPKNNRNYEKKIKQLPMVDLEPQPKLMAKMITNVFEYGTTTFGYATCAKLGDGRGFTCGLVGFTTGTNDALAVVVAYDKVKPNSELAKFIPELTRLSKLDWDTSGRDDTSKLGGFTEAWTKVSCTDPDFRAVQDKIADHLYLIPGLQLGEAAGISTNLGKAIMYDTAVQHGWEEDDGISLLTILNLVGPPNGRTEAQYLEDFIKVRWILLCCTKDNVWPASADRTSDLMEVLKTGNFDLNPPIDLKAYTANITGSEDPSKNIKGCSGSKKDKSGGGH
ncbi:hypothetical protein K7432_014997 [Basidiobolus ranarum]|uniref:Chitosanase n=1 Tax=Basidiobolus ranarum TaxID=34480 RepID=A0ABR2VNU5_9FUNG